MIQKSLIILIVTIGIISAEVVNFQECAKDFPEQVNNCTIHEVRISPCREASSGQACKVKLRRSVSIEYEFTPEFSAETLSNKVYWVSASNRLPFVDITADGCTLTTCPVVANQRQTYAYTLYAAKKYPTGTFDIEWSVSDPHHNKCCFVTQIRLAKN